MFFCCTHISNLVKTQIPFMWVQLTVLYENCLATVGVCIFRALALAGALFLLILFYGGTL